jgi:copper chaperone CopZ
MVQRSTFLIEGMTCEGCERTISKVVSNLQGVNVSKADLNTATLSVEYDPEKVSLDQIRAAVNRVGYNFVGQRPAYKQKEGSDNYVS